VQDFGEGGRRGGVDEKRRFEDDAEICEADAGGGKVDLVVADVDPVGGGSAKMRNSSSSSPSSESDSDIRGDVRRERQNHITSGFSNER
jgi:hypothetical protein